MERPALVDSTGQYRDLSDIVKDITPAWLGKEGLASLRNLDPLTLPAYAEVARIRTSDLKNGKA